MHKPILIILPGWGGNHETWADFIKLASNDFSVICIDLPCFGDEPCPDKVWGIEEYADFVKFKMSNVPARRGQMSKVVLLGHSFGGQVATYFTSKYPESIQALVLIGASAIRPRKLIRRIFFGAVAKAGKKILSLPLLKQLQSGARKIFLRGIGAHDSINPEGLEREIYKKVLRQDLRHLLPQIVVPTLVLWGSKDAMTPLRQGKKIAKLIPNAKLVVVHGGRHGLHLTHGTEAAEEIINFVRTL